MKEHEDRDMSTIEKSSAIVDSTAVEEIVTREGKIEGVLGERDEGEDMMVDVVGPDAIDLNRKTDSVRLIEECMQKETESHDLNMDMKEAAPAAGSGEDVSADIAVIDNKELRERGSTVEEHVESVEDCMQKETETRDLNMEEAAVSVEDDSVGSRVLGFEKVEVTVNEEGLKRSIEVRDCETDFESRGEPRFGGADIAAIDNKELTEICSTVEEHVESVEECMQKETETRDLNMNMEEAAVSCEDDSVGSKVLGFEKVEVTVDDEGSKTSIEVGNCEMAFESRGEPQFGGADIAAIDNKELTERCSTVEQHVESVVESTQKETETRDLDMNMEEAAVSVEGDSVGNRVLGFEKVEVTVIEEGLNTSLEVTACGSLVQDSKESSIGGGEIAAIDNKDVIKRGSTEEVVEQHVESFNELADRDRVMDRKTKKEAEILDSSKIAVSLEVDMIVVEGFASKDEAKDCVFVDPSLVSANNKKNSTELVNVGSDEDAGRSKEESLQPTIEVITDDSQGNASGEPRFVGGENDLKNKEESDRGLPKEIMEQPMECDQEMGVEDCTVNEKIVEESEPLDSSKISEPSTTTNPGSEDVDVVVVDAGLASKDEAQDGVSVDPNLVCADNRSLSSKVVDSATSEGEAIAQAENPDQQDEVIANDAQNLENGTGVRDSKSGVDSFSGEPRFDGEIAVIDIEETEKGLTADDEETENTGKGDEVLDSSKIQETLTAANLGPEDVLTTKIDSDSVASQLSGPPLVLESNRDPDGQHVDQLVGPENSRGETTIDEGKQSSVAEMLSQLHSVAQDPMKGYTFLNTIKPFFYDRRTAVGRPFVVRKRKTSNENEPEEFESDDVNDSYWTDRIVQNHPEEQSLQDNQNHSVAYEPDKPAKPFRRSNKKRFLFSNHEMGLKEQSELVERRRQNLATEVVLKFPEGFYFPSEIHLNKMFRRFGALMESETEVDRKNGRARVVFKKCCDAEVAHSSAGKFNIFGPINVNYELNYTPLVSYKPLLLSVLQDPMDAS